MTKRERKKRTDLIIKLYQLVDVNIKFNRNNKIIRLPAFRVYGQMIANKPKASTASHILTD